jgi:hypothetical protein
VQADQPFPLRRYMYISLVLSSSVRSMRLRNQSQLQFNFILLFPVASVIVLVNAYLQPNEYAEMSSFGKAHAHLNVMKKPLGLFSKDPMTGFYRNGYCQVGPEDRGNHAIAGISSPICFPFFCFADPVSSSPAFLNCFHFPDSLQFQSLLSSLRPSSQFPNLKKKKQPETETNPPQQH